MAIKLTKVSIVQKGNQEIQDDLYDGTDGTHGFRLRTW